MYICSKKKLCFISVIVSFIIISIIYMINNIIPFGNNTLLFNDFKNQYLPMLLNIINNIRSNKSLIYTFNSGLGFPLYRDFINYLTSPFNIIFLFANKNNIYLFVSILIGLKPILSSLTMCYYLSTKFKNNNILYVCLSILYAFSGYYCNYYFNIMWTDGMIFLPLIILGIEHIINNNKWKLYTISLSCMIFSNYYIAYMICLFTIVYFIFYSIYKNKIHKKSIKYDINNISKKFIIYLCSSLFSILICSFTLNILLNIGDTLSSLSSRYLFLTLQYPITIKSFLIHHLTGSIETRLFSEPLLSPAITCGILSVILLIIYMFNSKISLRNKICYLGLLLLFIIIFFTGPIDSILNLFHFPNEFPFRYSFIYIFILIAIASYSFNNIYKINIKLVFSLCIFLISLIITIINKNIFSISNTNIIINIILIICYFILIYYMKNYKYISLIFIILASLECIISFNSNILLYYNTSNTYDNNYQDKINYINSYDNSFYRVVNTNYDIYTGLEYNYKDVGFYTSMVYSNLGKFMSKFGYAALNNYSLGNYVTPVNDLLFDVKYVVGDISSNYYTEISDNIYKNNYDSSLMFGINKQNSNITYDDNNLFNNLNNLVNNISGIDNIFDPVKPDSIDINNNIVTYKFNNIDNLFIYINSDNINYFIVNNNLYYYNNSYKKDNIDSNIVLNKYYAFKIMSLSSDSLIISYKNYNNDSLCLYKINDDKYKLFVNYINNNKFNMTVFNEDYIEGNINLDRDSQVYTSIPYDKNIEVYVDDKKINTYMFDNVLLTFDIDRGYHNIKIKYNILFMIPGIIMSLVSIFIFVLICIYDKKKKC